MAAVALPVFATAAEVWRFVLHAQGPLVRIAAPWLLAAFALAWLPPRIGLGGAEIWAFAGQLVDALGYAVTGSRFVRRLVAGEPWPAGPALPDAAAWRYLLGQLFLFLAAFAAGFAVGLLLVLPAALSGFAPLAAAGVLAAALAALWAAARLAPLPVFATTGRGFDPLAAFRLTRGQAARIVLVQFATLVPLAVVSAVGLAMLGAAVGGETAAEPSGPVFVLVELILRSVGYAEAALIATALAAITVRLELHGGSGAGSA